MVSELILTGICIFLLLTFIFLVLKEIADKRGIYAIYFDGVLMYVGMSNNYENRIKKHGRDLQHHRHYNKKLQFQYNRLKNPDNQISIIILSKGVIFGLRKTEKDYIKKLNPKCNIQNNRN